MAGRGNRSSGGFTLVELLVAMALLALLSTLVFGGFRFGARAWERAGAHIDHAAEMQVVQAFLRVRLSEAAPVLEAGENRERLIAFAGDADALRFVTIMPTHLETGGYSTLALSLDRRDGGGDLVLRWSPFQFGAGAAAEAEADERVLLTGVSDIDFAYFGRLDQETGRPAWRDDWRDATNLPRLVRIRLVFEDASRRDWPELVAAPVVTERARRRRRR